MTLDQDKLNVILSLVESYRQSDITDRQLC